MSLWEHPATLSRLEELRFMTERTLSIIKPDALRKNVIGEILRRFEARGLRIVAAKLLRLSKREAEEFYTIHQDRPVFDSLTTSMSSGPILVSVLEGKDAIQTSRRIMGATNPAEAEPGTIRADYATNIEANAVHGSDALTTAQWEVSYFFGAREIH